MTTLKTQPVESPDPLARYGAAETERALDRLLADLGFGTEDEAMNDINADSQFETDR